MSRITARDTTRPPPEDIPCSRRKNTSEPTFCDSAQPTDPTMKTAIAIENTMRGPKRSAVQPLAGMNTASESR